MKNPPYFALQNIIYFINIVSQLTIDKKTACISYHKGMILANI